MLPVFHSTPFRMRNDKPDRPWAWGWALLAALVIHLLIAALVLPRSLVVLPKAEQAITVELVRLPPQPVKEKTSERANVSKPEKPQGTRAEVSSPTNNSGAQQAASPALKPVFLFGDKDLGPRNSLDGSSAESRSAAPARPDAVKPDPPQTLPMTTAAATGQVPPGLSSKAPTSESAAQVQPGSKLQAARILYSQDATADISSMTAMGSMPRGQRAGQLCSTELGEQLVHALPAYFPDSLPLDRLQEGTVIEVPRTAFQSNSQWYALSYRCEVDPQATKVVSFAFKVGKPVSRSDWKSLGIPSQ